MKEQIAKNLISTNLLRKMRRKIAEDAELYNAHMRTL
jgi:hypothetical protein